MAVALAPICPIGALPAASTSGELQSPAAVTSISPEELKNTKSWWQCMDLQDAGDVIEAVSCVAPPRCSKRHRDDSDEVHPTQSGNRPVWRCKLGGEGLASSLSEHDRATFQHFTLSQRGQGHDESHEFSSPSAVSALPDPPQQDLHMQQQHRHHTQQPAIHGLPRPAKKTSIAHEGQAGSSWATTLGDSGAGKVIVQMGPTMEGIQVSLQMAGQPGQVPLAQCTVVTPEMASEAPATVTAHDNDRRKNSGSGADENSKGSYGPSMRVNPFVRICMANQVHDAPPLAFVSSTPKRVLVLDNDETWGAFQPGSLLFNMFISLSATRPDVNWFVNNYLQAGRGARPGARQLLQTAALMKQQGYIDHIVMFTAASNKHGWVHFLRDCLEIYAGLPAGTVSHVICMEHCTKRHRNGRLMKDLRHICPDTSHVLIVDDKPEYVQCGQVIPVSEYQQHVDISGMIQDIPCTDEGRGFAEDAYREDIHKFPPTKHDFSNDNELFHVESLIKDFFGCTIAVDAA